MFSHFRRQKRFCGKSSHAYSFEDRYILTPKIKKVFFENIILKALIFSKFRKAVIYIVVLLVCYRHAKFELGISIFDSYGKKLLKLMTSKIQTIFLPLLTTYNKTKTTIGFPVMSCIEQTAFMCKKCQPKNLSFFT